MGSPRTRTQSVLSSPNGQTQQQQQQGIVPGLIGDAELHMELVRVATSLGVPLIIVLREYYQLLRKENPNKK